MSCRGNRRIKFAFVGRRAKANSHFVIAADASIFSACRAKNATVNKYPDHPIPLNHLQHIIPLQYHPRQLPLKLPLQRRLHNMTCQSRAGEPQQASSLPIVLPPSPKNAPPQPTEPRASTSPTTSSTYTIRHFEHKNR